mmetsp:Transcript_25181/g.63380  ORF Transcript_25181/g.63380 Transcript_25181/m.63380 type:complete len:250 (+) Transcript_25181:958-1707(+)
MMMLSAGGAVFRAGRRQTCGSALCETRVGRGVEPEFRLPHLAPLERGRTEPPAQVRAPVDASVELLAGDILQLADEEICDSLQDAPSSRMPLVEETVGRLFDFPACDLPQLLLGDANDAEAQLPDVRLPDHALARRYKKPSPSLVARACNREYVPCTSVEAGILSGFVEEEVGGGEELGQAVRASVQNHPLVLHRQLHRQHYLFVGRLHTQQRRFHDLCPQVLVWKEVVQAANEQSSFLDSTDFDVLCR